MVATYCLQNYKDMEVFLLTVHSVCRKCKMGFMRVTSLITNSSLARVTKTYAAVQFISDLILSYFVITNKCYVLPGFWEMENMECALVLKCF